VPASGLSLARHLSAWISTSIVRFWPQRIRGFETTGGEVVERQYPAAAVERAMKVQEVIMRAMAKQMTGGKPRKS